MHAAGLTERAAILSASPIPRSGLPSSSGWPGFGALVADRRRRARRGGRGPRRRAARSSSASLPLPGVARPAPDAARRRRRTLAELAAHARSVVPRLDHRGALPHAHRPALRTSEVTIGPDQPFCIIGERINPTGRKAFAAQLRERDLSQVVLDVEEQVAAGAHVLDVNMGVPLTDEAELLATARAAGAGARATCRCASTRASSRRWRPASPPTRARRWSTRSPARTTAWSVILPLVKQHGAAVIAWPTTRRASRRRPSERLEVSRQDRATSPPRSTASRSRTS